MPRKIRMGMVGGGQGAFIGSVHRMAAALDGKIELVCGALSSEPERARASGAEIGLPADRAYGSWKEMFEAEGKRPGDGKMECVSIVTPNNTHFPIAAAALEAGFHVICDKPLAFNLDEARKLAAIVRETGLVFGLTHNYTGYPMVKEAREIARSGALGKTRRVVVEYPQGWMATPLEKDGLKQAAWRTDPSRAGASFTMGDIGTHAANLAEYVTGLEIEELCADLRTFVPGRALDDDGSVLLRFSGGAGGLLWASGIAVGEENGLNIRVYGEKGALKWRQEEPNTLEASWLDKPRQLLRTGVMNTSPAAAGLRLPPGHPEGFIEGFANIYRNFALAVEAHGKGEKATAEDFDFPGIREGIRGMAFIEAVVESSREGRRWVGIKA